MNTRCEKQRPESHCELLGSAKRVALSLIAWLAQVSIAEQSAQLSDLPHELSMQLNIELYRSLIKHCPLFQRLNNSQESDQATKRIRTGFQLSLA